MSVIASDKKIRQELEESKRRWAEHQRAQGREVSHDRVERECVRQMSELVRDGRIKTGY